MQLYEQQTLANLAGDFLRIAKCRFFALHFCSTGDQSAKTLGCVFCSFRSFQWSKGGDFQICPPHLP